MYLDEVKIKVIRNSYDEKKPKQKVEDMTFDFDGLCSRDLHKFLDNLKEDLHHRTCGKVTCNIVIDTDDDRI